MASDHKKEVQRHRLIFERTPLLERRPAEVVLWKEIERLKELCERKEA